MFRIPAEAEKGNRDRLLPMTPDFAEHLETVPEGQRHSRVFKLLASDGSPRHAEFYAGSKIVCAIGKAAGVVVDERTKRVPAKGDKPRLSSLENAAMQVVWSTQRATADDVRLALAPQQALKESTVRTILRRLEEKGYVEHDVEGRTYVYRPRVAPQNVAAQQVRGIIDRLCRGSV